MPFPLIKIAYLAIRQISKPLALGLKRSAKEYPSFRKYILIPPAQLYHSIETKFKMRLLDLGKKTQKVTPLTDEMAVELGADMLGEIIVFSVAVFTIFLEYHRQKSNEAKQERGQDDRIVKLEEELSELNLEIEKQNVEIKHLTRLFYSQIPQTDSKVQKKG